MPELKDPYGGFNSLREFLENVFYDLAGSYIYDPVRRGELVSDLMESVDDVFGEAESDD